MSNPISDEDKAFIIGAFKELLSVYEKRGIPRNIYLSFSLFTLVLAIRFCFDKDSQAKIFINKTVLDAFEAPMKVRAGGLRE